MVSFHIFKSPSFNSQTCHLLGDVFSKSLRYSPFILFPSLATKDSVLQISSLRLFLGTLGLRCITVIPILFLPPFLSLACHQLFISSFIASSQLISISPHHSFYIYTPSTTFLLTCIPFFWFQSLVFSGLVSLSSIISLVFCFSFSKPCYFLYFHSFIILEGVLRI